MESSSSGDPLSRTGGTSRPRPGDQLGRYRIESEIGSGAQGAVFLARDGRLDRRVALKVLHRAAGTDETVELRLAREAQLAARINDPSACEVYEFGTEGSYAFLAMRYVEGEPLDAFVRARPDDAPLARREVVQRLLWIEQAAEALHKAHVLGILHRDIKPGNFVVAADGRAVLLDFGIAKETGTPDSTQTIEGVVSGTPSYMSPEQLTLDGPALDGRSDVYSLAVTLFELIARRPAFGTGNEVFPTLASRQMLPDFRPVVAAWGKDLQAVLERALAVDRVERYDSALAFAEDVRRCRLRLPVAARPIGAWLRLRRWSSRNRALAAATFGLAASLVVGTALSLWFALSAVQAKDESEWSRYVGDLVLASQYITSAQPEAAAARLQASPEALRDYEWQHLLAQTDDTRVSVQVGEVALTRVLRAADGGVLVVDRDHALHRLVDGRVVDVDRPDAVASGVVLAGDVSEGLRVQAVEDGDAVYLKVTGGGGSFDVPCPMHPFHVRIAPDDSGALLYGSQGVFALNAVERRVIGPVEMRLSCSTFVAGRDGLRVIAVQSDGLSGANEVALLSWPELRRASTLEVPLGACTALSVSSDQSRVFFAMQDLFVDRTARVLAYDCASGREVGRYEGAMGAVEKLVVSPGDDWVALGEASGLLRILDGGLTSELRQYVGQRGSRLAMVALDARRLAAVNDRGELQEFEVMPAPRRAMTRPPIGKGADLRFDAVTGRLWVSTGIGARGFDLVGGGPMVEFYGNCSAIGVHGTRVWTHPCVDGAAVVERDLERGVIRDVIELPEHWVRSAVLLPDERRALFVAFRKPGNELVVATVADDEQPAEIRRLGPLPSGSPVMSLNRSRDAVAVAMGTHVSVWDLRDGRRSASCSVMEPVDVLAWAEGDRLVTSGASARLELRDRDLRPLSVIELPAKCVAVESHPTSARLVVLDETGALGVCSLDPPQYLVTSPRVAGAVSVALAPDAGRLATASEDGVVQVLPAPRAPAVELAAAPPSPAAATLAQRLARRLVARMHMFGYAERVGRRLPDIAKRPFLPRLFYEVCAEASQVDTFGFAAPRSATRRAMSLTWLGRHDEARELLYEVVGRQRPYPLSAMRPMRTMALLEAMAGDRQAAREAFTALVEDCFKQDIASVHKTCGDVVAAVEDPNGARALRWLLLHADDDEPVAQQVARIEGEDGAFAALIEALWAGAEWEADPFRLFAWLVVSEPDLAPERYRAAIRWERRAAAIEASEARPELRAAALLRLGEPDEALAILDGMPAVDPFRAVVRNWFTALACVRTGDRERARRLYAELVLQLNARQLRDCELRAEIREEVRRALDG